MGEKNNVSLRGETRHMLRDIFSGSFHLMPMECALSTQCFIQIELRINIQIAPTNCDSGKKILKQKELFTVPFDK
jgi:hypothetical protein